MPVTTTQAQADLARAIAFQRRMAAALMTQIAGAR